MRMLYITSTRFSARVITTSLLLLFGMHYTWLWYQSHVQHASSASPCKETLAETFNLNDISPKDSKTTQITAEKLNKASMVYMFTRCEKRVFVLIVVFSSPTNFERRSTIRSTWAKIKHTDLNKANSSTHESSTQASLVKTVFLLGQTNEKTQSIVESEAQYYKDIVIGSFTDTYGNLTLKTKLGLEWAQQFCKFKYYLKTDDDVFVYSKGVVQWLWQLPSERVYTGRCDFNKKVIRTAGHKWGVSKKEYPRDTFPPYCVGMGYILSSDVIQNITSIVGTQPFFKLEDVYVGLILEKLKIVPVDRRKYLQVHSDYSWDVCKHKDLLLSLEANPKQMLELHLKFSKLWKCGPVDYSKS